MLQSQKSLDLNPASHGTQTQSKSEAFERKNMPSLIKATRFYFAAASNLHDRFYGTLAEHDMRPKIAKLVKDEEITLLQRVFLFDDLGCAPKMVDIQAMADMILMEREETFSKRVTGYWVKKFVNRLAELIERLKKRKQEKGDLAALISNWFRRVENIKAIYDIHENDIYNLSVRDMELCAHTKRVFLPRDTGRRRQRTRKKLDMATVIECTNSTGWAMPAFINFQIGPFLELEAEEIPADWQIEISLEPWNPHNIGLHWLQNHFHPKTEGCVKGQFRLLVLDGQADKLGFAFYRLCELYKIIPLCIPPKLSHILLPLDTWPFGELGKSYCKRVKESVIGKASVDKLHYLGEYVYTRREVMNECQIRESFEAVGLVPYDPKKVILEYTCLSQSRPHTPSPSPSPSPLMTTKEIPAEEPKTPTSLEELRQLKKQFYLCSRENQLEEFKIKHCIFEKVAKGCEMNMRQVAIWEKHAKQQNCQIKSGQSKSAEDKGLSHEIENKDKVGHTTKLSEKRVSDNIFDSGECEIMMKTDENKNSILKWVKNLKRSTLLSESVNKINDDSSVSELRLPSRSSSHSGGFSHKPIPFPPSPKKEREIPLLSPHNGSGISGPAEFLRPLSGRKSRSTSNVNNARSDTLSLGGLKQNSSLFRKKISESVSKGGHKEIKSEQGTIEVFPQEESAENKSSSSGNDIDTNQDSASFWTRYILWM
ncbi:DDE superfamily endonuclease [Metschnikowia aff. pulcherrima]|uniref:DDE superfamily endonuclease n=1 Tax=Metschnikowia aff. pulcherrima TaxID=2163413 RepID=A0A4P6XKG7_9ASCO|nr:DDE superfamily endonuclease [Metschnikowia aff. pulcherrima]